MIVKSFINFHQIRDILRKQKTNHLPSLSTENYKNNITKLF